MGEVGVPSRLFDFPAHSKSTRFTYTSVEHLGLHARTNDHVSEDHHGVSRAAGGLLTAAVRACEVAALSLALAIQLAEAEADREHLRIAARDLDELCALVRRNAVVVRGAELAVLPILGAEERLDAVAVPVEGARPAGDGVAGDL